MTNTTLASQAIARICHDLISPIGAISNGVELLGEINGRSPELDLVAQSARAARDKIRFFRIAFDGASPRATVSGKDLAQTAEAMFETARMRVSPLWMPETIARDEARLLLLLMLCVETALPLGGQLDIAQTAQGWKFTGHGRRLAVEPDFWAHVQHGSAVGASSATRVHFSLARKALDDCGQSLHVEVGDTRLALELRNP